jgi:hypothetical protein
MSILAKLAITNPCDINYNDLLKIVGCKSYELSSTLKTMFTECLDSCLLVRIAILHSRFDYQDSLENILIDKIGADAYCDLANKHNL